MDFIQINVALREENGSAAVRRLRRSGKVPANLYGLGRRNLSLTHDRSCNALANLSK